MTPKGVTTHRLKTTALVTGKCNTRNTWQDSWCHSLVQTGKEFKTQVRCPTGQHSTSAWGSYLLMRRTTSHWSALSFSTGFISACEKDRVPLISIQLLVASFCFKSQERKTASAAATWKAVCERPDGLSSARGHNGLRTQNLVAGCRFPQACG